MVTRRILIIDDAAILREPLAASLRLAGYESLCASDGKEALLLLRSSKPDLILLDLAMPRMDGLTFLRRLRSDPACSETPVILLTASSDKKHVLEAAKLKVQGYVLKTAFSLQQLLERVEKLTPAHEPHTSPVGPWLHGVSSVSVDSARPSTEPAQITAVSPAPADPVESGSAGQSFEIPQLLTTEQCVQRAEKALQTKTLSGVVMQVLSLAASPRGDASQLISLIARDPMLSARVLKAANTSTYASSRGVVTTIPDAVRNIGSETVRNIAAAMGIFNALPETTADGFNPIRCWQHSFAVARLCEQLTTASSPEDGGVAYLVGLCHDLGEIMLRSTFAAEYRQILDVQARTGRRRDEVEREMLGMNHNDLVVTILRCLGLPDTIRVPIETFYSVGPGKPLGSGAPALAKVLRIANLYANGLLMASSGSARVFPLTPAECRAATGQEAPVPPEGEQFRCEVLSLTGTLARLSAQEETELMKPMYQRQRAQLWIARDPAFSAFDPVAAALGSLTEADIHDRLPIEDREWTEHCGVVVIAKSSVTEGFGGAEIAKSLALRARGPIPVLWLVAKIEPTSKPFTPAPQALPVTLDQLADFVKALAPQRG